MKRLINANNLQNELTQLQNNIPEAVIDEQNEVYDLMEEILQDLDNSVVTASVDDLQIKLYQLQQLQNDYLRKVQEVSQKIDDLNVINNKQKEINFFNKFMNYVKTQIS